MNAQIQHTMNRLAQRGITYHPFTLEAMAEKCEVDTAIVLGQLKVSKGQTYGYYCDRESNGELVVMIVRSRRPNTIMFRRLNQPLTNEALRVSAIQDLRKNKRD